MTEFHQDALNLRDKLIGHKDAIPARGHTTTPNVVLLHINSKEFYLHTAIIGEMEPPMRNALKELCAYFLQRCEEKLRPLTQRYFSEVMRHSPGIYEVVISEPPDDWISPFQLLRPDTGRAPAR